METKDDIKNTAKYMDDSLLHKDDSDEGVQVMKKYKRRKAQHKRGHEKTVKEVVENQSPEDSLSPQESEPLLPEKDSPGALRRKSLMPSKSMSLSSSQSLQSPSPWTSLLNEPEVDLN